ncbi:sporulation-induced protein [Exophiala xenobiotica]|uniref:Sporulation-induced protein n=1 Tax=Lithohypha guttulata TaxID=1690604 RepID=A0ABR0K8I1_9EURO|nr:sporulation-induced protein [Lithohypha guttulata]KAK5316881.1 sporulation-induced protein [Exophiala xenobiotica]
MFWRFGGYSNVSTIDTLLDKQSTTLEDLLEEQDLVQELKSHHTKLIEFLRDDNHLHSLLKYVVAPGPIIEESEDPEEEHKVDEEQERAEKKRLKYAFVACEILSCETWSITEAVMSNTEFLKEFWEFLRRPVPLDPLQAGYFTKVNETLLEKKTEDMLAFFKSLPEIVPAILQHVDCPMVMDLLLKIISLEKAEGGAGIVEWLHDQDLITKLLSSLSLGCNSSTQTSAGDFLKAIITISANAAQNEQSCIGPNSLTRQLVSEPCIQQLISHMLRGGNPLTVGVGIIIEVIRKNNSDYDPENGLNQDAPPTTHDPIFLGTLLRQFARHVPDFMSLILSSKHTVSDGEKTKTVDRGVLKSAWGQDIEPLGFDRFKTCELMAELLHCSNMGLLNEVGSEEFVKARDAERERLRAAGKFSLAKQQSDDSTIDMSMASSKLDSSFAPSIGTLPEERPSASEEDEFERVSVSETDKKASSSEESDEMVDEPLTPTKPTLQAQNEAKSPAHGLDENVRRLSLEDTEMSTDLSDISTNSPSGLKPGDTPLHPEDKPAPLFAKREDNDKIPTPASPEPPNSPRANDTSMTDLLTSTSAGSGEVSSMSELKQAAKDPSVVGDYLKMMFVEHRVVPTILSFFFRFPWNNFLHNVVYDVVQQVFNGPMERGYNRYLAFDLFGTGKVTQQIIEGQQRSEEAEKKKNMRLGYMGHLTLVAEEVVKFGERHSRDTLSELVQSHIYGKDWEDYVTKTLAETRDRDNAILGGFRPENGLGPRQAVLNAVNASSGFAGSNALAQAGLAGGQQGPDSVDLSNNGSATSSSYQTAGSSLLSGFGSSSDDDDDDMSDENDDGQVRTAAVQLSTADTGPSTDSDQPMPVIPPPPAPLNIEPSRARKRLADRLAMHKAQQEQDAQEAAASEFGMEDDPFAALGDNDDNNHDDPFSLDEEEQDITSFGKRSNTHTQSSSGATYSTSRGTSNLFSSQSDKSYLRGSLENGSSSDSGSDEDTQHTAVEARTSLERRPLDVDDDDDDEMGEMVGPSEGPNSSDEEDLTASERHQLGLDQSKDDDESSEFDGQEDREDDVVEIPLPSNKRRSRGSVG